MPASASARKTIKGSQPQHTGSYAGSTVPQLHGAASNKTAEFLNAIPAEHPGQQAFYREAVTMPDPLGSGQQINYGQLQEMLNGPKRAQALDAFARANKLDRVTSQAMQDALFQQGRAALVERGAANPNEFAFPTAAAEALQAPVRGRLIKAGNFITPEASGQATNAAVQAQRFANLTDQTGTYAAPGVALPGSPAPVEAPAPQPRVRLIRGVMGQGIAAR
jgi:hypothetical protein